MLSSNYLHFKLISPICSQRSATLLWLSPTIYMCMFKAFLYYSIASGYLFYSYSAWLISSYVCASYSENISFSLIFIDKYLSRYSIDYVKFYYILYKIKSSLYISYTFLSQSP